jgi:hypothetical protein
MSETKLIRDHHLWTRDTIKNVTGDVTLDLAGDLTIDVAGGQCTIQDNTAGDPDLYLKNTSDDEYSSVLFFQVDRGGDGGTAGEDNDQLGSMSFLGYNDAGTPEAKSFSTIASSILDATDGSEAGKLTLKVLTKDSGGTGSGLEEGLILTGSDTNDEVDVTIANGTASITTIAGDLNIAGDTITSVGALEIDPGGALSITGQDVNIDTAKKLYLDGGSDTYIQEILDDVLRFYVGNRLMIEVSEFQSKITLAASNHVAALIDGTEFSATNSAYAGMMLGCTHVFGSGTGGVFVQIGTAWENLLWDTDKYALVTFVVPPSNKVKISVHLPWIPAGSFEIRLGLATDSSATTLNTKYENDVDDANRSDSFNLNYSWVVDGSDHSWSAGETKTLYIMAYAASNVRFYTGGTNTSGYGGVIVEATALPVTIGDGSEP